MDEGPTARIKALRTALKRQARDHPRLRPAGPRNGARHLAVELSPEGPTGVLRIDPEDAVLIVLDALDSEVGRESLDLRFEEGYCWDEILCARAEELADLLLTRAESLLEQQV